MKSREEMEEIKNNILKEFQEQTKDNEITWVKKRHKFEPYPPVDLVYPKI